MPLQTAVSIVPGSGNSAWKGSPYERSGPLFGASLAALILLVAGSVDPKGRTIYAGAIDDKPSASQADLKTAKNFVRAAMGEALAGKPVSTPSTSPYGCSVKY